MTGAALVSIPMKMLLLDKRLLPLLILGILLLLAFIAFNNPPEANRKPPSTAPRITVEITEVSSAPYQVVLQSYGTVQPRTRSMLVSQVGGQVKQVSLQFRDGGTFAAGDILLEIDPRDHQADVKIAEATLLDAQQALAEEEARSAQAKADWERLENRGEAPILVLRKPQLMAAQARVISAEAALTKARLSLERTRIIAPFAGRILKKQVDLGQVVSPSSQLAEIYATDYVEIRLPLRNRDLGFITLPEHQSNQNGEVDAPINAAIASTLGKGRIWPAEIVRTEGAIDENARQLHIVAQIDDPFGVASEDANPLKIGEYVTAEIKGRLLEEAIVIPNATIYQGSYVYIVENGVLLRRNIEIAWQNEEEAIVATGLKPGENHGSHNPRPDNFRHAG